LDHAAAARNAFTAIAEAAAGRDDFGTFWFASLLSSVGTWAQQVAHRGCYWTLGASSFLVGLDSFRHERADLAPDTPGGVLADHWRQAPASSRDFSRFRCVPDSDLILLLAGMARPWAIILISLVVGITDALSMPSFSSIVPSIVTHDQIPAVWRSNSTQYNVSRSWDRHLPGS